MQPFTGETADHRRRYETYLYKMTITTIEQPVDKYAVRPSAVPASLARPRGARILAIDPGTSLMGIAVLEGNDLLYYGVKELRRHRPAPELVRATRALITNLVDQYAPTVLAYEESVYVQQTSSMLLRSVEREIRRTALTERLRTLAYTPAYVRQHICGDPWSTKHMVAARLAERFPELHRYRTGQSARSERYWLNMFDALAVAIVAVADLEARDQSDTGPLGRTA